MRQPSQNSGKMFLKTRKILFILKERLHYGMGDSEDYSSAYPMPIGLSNSAGFVARILNDYGIEAKTVSVTDSNGIDKVVTEENPDVVILEALFVPPVKVIELLSIPRHQKREWVIRIHSKFGFIATEGVAMGWVRVYAETARVFGNLTIAPNVEEQTNDLKTCFPYGKFVYLPNVYYAAKNAKIRKEDKVENVVKVAMPGAIRPLKNHLTNVVAAIKFAEKIGKKLQFYVNGRKEQWGDNVYKNIRALFEGHKKNELVSIGWLQHDEFLNFLRNIDVVLQVSYTETFNIVAADAVHVGTPVVVSRDIEWMNPKWMANENSTEDIANKMLDIYYSDKAPLVLENKKYLSEWNFMATRHWLDYITSLDIC